MKRPKLYKSYKTLPDSDLYESSEWIQSSVPQNGIIISVFHYCYYEDTPSSCGYEWILFAKRGSQNDPRYEIISQGISPNLELAKNKALKSYHQIFQDE